MATISVGANQTGTINEGNIQDGGDYTAVNLASNSTLVVDGVDVSLSGINVQLLSSSTITSTNGAYTTINTLSALNIGSSLTYNIDGSSTIELGTGLNAGLLNNTTIAFTGDGNGTLALQPGLNLDILSSANVTGFGAGDQIDFGGNATSIEYTPNGSNTGGTLTFYNGALPVGSVNLVGEYDPTLFTYDAETGTVGYACFLRGTRIATLQGEVAVEDLKPGDEVLTHDGRAIAIKWIGRRTLQRDAIPEANKVKAMPVRIRKDALGENVPCRDLIVSPWHHMYFDGVLVPAVLLVNGQTIVQDFEIEIFEYFHVELETFEIITAEGAATESYLDTGNRSMFENAGVVALHPTFAPEHLREVRSEARRKSNIPVAYNGEALQRVRRRLLARAEYMTSLSRTKDENLRLVLDGETVVPVVKGRFRAFDLKAKPASTARLLSRIAGLRDAREDASLHAGRVGVCVIGLWVRDSHGRHSIPLDHPALTGFHPPRFYNSRMQRWTTDQAAISAELFEGFEGTLRLEMQIENGGLLYWTEADEGESRRSKVA